MYRFISGLVFIFILTSCSNLPVNTTEPSYALKKSSNAELERQVILAHQQAGLAEDTVTMLLLEDGVDAFAARLSLINSAQYSVDLQYYLYHSDLSGGLLTIALWEAAERGVRIRLLLDDMDMQGKDKTLSALSSHPNINIRLFNPFIRGKNRTSQYVYQFGSITRRMHNKSMTVDGSITILGGRNIGDAYFGADENTVFGDLDVALTGHIVEQVSASFDSFWNNQLSYSATLLSDYQWNDDDIETISQLFKEKLQEEQQDNYVKVLKENRLIELIHAKKVKAYSGEAYFLADQPDKISASRDKTEYNLAPQLAPYINAVKEELIIVSPYFVPGDGGVAFFEDLIERGVEIKILTNSLKSNDVMVVHAGYSKYRKALLKMGVKIYEMDSQLFTSKKLFNQSKKKKSLVWGKSKASLHAKYFIIDRQSTFIGSLNLDPRSFYENTEIGVVLASADLSADVAQNFDDLINLVAFELSLQDGDIVWSKTLAGKTTTYNHEPYSSWWERFMVGFASFLPGESQL